MKWTFLFVCWSLWCPLARASLLPGEGITVSGVVWRDDDVDGSRGPSEEMLRGFRVYLRSCDDPTPVTPIVRTDSNGEFEFTGVTLTSYRVVYQAPEKLEAAYSITKQNARGEDPDTNYAMTDSDADPSTGITPCLNSTQEYTDAGFFLGATVGHKVWLDVDADGVQQPTDAGLSGVPVAVVCLWGQFQRDTTTVDGIYTLEVPLGECDVIFVIPTGYVVSAVPDNCIITDPEVMCSVSVTANVSNMDVGLYPGGMVGDLVWLDSNANGIRDDNEAGLEAATVHLVNCSDKSDILDVQMTNKEGEYWFAAVPPGSFMVQFHAPFDVVYGRSPAVLGTPMAMNPSTGTTTCFPIGMGEIQDKVIAGFYKSATLQCVVWDDADSDGKRSTAESGLAGLTVAVACQGFTASGLTAGADGLYSVSVPVGSCTVTFARLQNYAVSSTPGCVVNADTVECHVAVSGNQAVGIGMQRVSSACGGAFASPAPASLALTTATGTQPAEMCFSNAGAWGWRLPQTRSSTPQTLPLWLGAARCDPRRGKLIGGVTLSWPTASTFVVAYHVAAGYRIPDAGHHVYVGIAPRAAVALPPSHYEASTLRHGGSSVTYTRDSSGDFTIVVAGLPDPTVSSGPYYAIIQGDVLCSADAPVTNRASGRHFFVSNTIRASRESDAMLWAALAFGVLVVAAAAGASVGFVWLQCYMAARRTEHFLVGCDLDSL